MAAISSAIPRDEIFRSGLSLSFPVELMGGRFYFHCVFKNEILILGNEKASSKGTAVNFFLSFVLCVKEMILLSPLCHHHLLELFTEREKLCADPGGYLSWFLKLAELEFFGGPTRNLLSVTSEVKKV